MLATILRRLRCEQHTTLPDFLIIGAQRGGTTSLHHYLALHPDVLPADVKEVHYFDLNYASGADWYRARFPRKEHPGQRAGEASPYYLFHPLVPARVRALAPDVKLLALLRNPVERALSHYQLSVHRGVETLPFEEALDREPDRLAGEAERLLADPTYHSRAHQYFSYQARGFYTAQLEAWFAHFPRRQFLLLASEDLYRAPATVYAQVLDFLGLKAWQPERFSRRNGYDYADMAPATRRRLVETFVPANQQLYRLLGKDLGWERAASIP